jgi:hypothetical protein
LPNFDSNFANDINFYMHQANFAKKAGLIYTFAYLSRPKKPGTKECRERSGFWQNVNEAQML